MAQRRRHLLARGGVIGMGCILLVLAGCGSDERVATEQAAGLEPRALPRPGFVVVQDFRVEPDAVLLDPGFAAAFIRSAGGVGKRAAQREVAARVRMVVASVLADRIRFMGLEPVRDPPRQAATPYVVIEGRVQAIDQGDSTSRRLLGFRRGQSHVRAAARVVYMQPGAPPLAIGMIAGSGESGWAPGMALDLGFGLATGTLLTSVATSAGTQAVTYSHGSASADAAALARQMADELGGLFARQGWITASVLQHGPPASARLPTGASARPVGLAAE
jgi:hypothetical protein